VTAPASVLSVGVGTPGLRLDAGDVAAAWGERGKGRVAACADDEDTLTLAWTAAEAALRHAQQPADAVDALFWGTGTPPYADGPSHATLATALGLSSHAGGALLSGSPHSGVEALLAAWDAVVAGSARTAVVVASDAALPGPGTAYERRAGAGAVAVVVVAGDAGPAVLTGRATRSEPVLDHYRGATEPATRDVYDARLFREQTFLPATTEITTSLAAGAALDAWSLPDPDGRLGAALGRRLGTTPASAAVFAALGDTGAAAALLGAVPALATPGRIGVVGYGGGRTTGVTVDVLSPVPGADVLAALDAGRAATYAEVLRARGQLRATGETVPMGVPPGSAMFVRGGREMLALLGARCVDCGVVSTPPSIHPTCTGCGGDKLEEVALARRGRVQTFVVNHAMPAPFVAPLPLAVVDLEDGARLMLQVVGDGAELAIGDPVRLVLRRYALERGASVYGWKAERV
jgi:hydroxymethylglutaryl-CoA synthase